MTKPFMFEKPLGMRDTLPSLYEAKKSVRNKMIREIGQWGYQFMETPTLEYYETVGEASAILDQQLFKLLDQQGHTLVLRPDMTAPIARVAASRLKNDGYPQRLAYSTNVFRAQQNEAGRPAEFEQIGTECIGDRSISADAEMIALMVSLLQKVNVKTYTIAIGHIGFLHGIFLEIVGTEERAATLRRFLYEKNYVGYREHVKQLPLSSIDKRRLLHLLKLRGDFSNIQQAKEVLEGEAGKNALEDLDQLWTMLKAYGVTDAVKLDLTIVSHMSYYTGIVFESYADNVGFPIGNGGRYDKLFEKFDREQSATGFGINLDRLLEAIEVKKLEPVIHGILFSQERRMEAIAFANQKRKDGEKVILQDIAGVENVDACTASFAEVTFFLGKTRKESE
ncbi:ATP phosphoribosyltransferase regulatory subunit [Sutcliffiella rhizosphaerae]|uniref:ATP phosphoribosyltransferase regulatory subunit n=1 Tax=Sutcliffiella rhizosphaerae TaxID=2880967 RepID=A0ABM8YLH9_9BACI|nr:ATP phosphoribosyltransferase regulatory subunit [Sutcliffiella rhizosphaerae]CAG9620700.1 ATP phosphoribosyltransferase regulatory subunit [Sutcliffiella rhizosphaerae]